MKAVVRADRLAYLDKGARQVARKGESVELSEDDFERHARDGAVERPGKSRGSDGESAWPRTHADLDAIAIENDVAFSSDDLKVDEKIAELEAASVAPPPDES